MDNTYWLNEPLGIGWPNNISGSLVGLYYDSGYTSVALTITVNRTEYRVIRLFKKLETDTSKMRQLHKNMIDHYINKYKSADYKAIIKKFLSWSNNKTHHAVLSRFM